MKRILRLIAIQLLVVNAIAAQDFQYTQFYAAPLYLNPAFTGSISGVRAGINNRVQWIGLPKAFVSSSFGVDYNLDRINCGVGLLATYDKAGTGGLSSTNISALYSYRVMLNKYWTLRNGLQFTYGSRSIDFYKLTFGDQLDKSGNTASISAEQLDRFNAVNYFDFSYGFVVNNAISWLGFSAHHINQPRQSLIADEDHTLPVKLSLHGGYKFFLKQNGFPKKYGEYNEISLTPTFMYKRQGKIDQFDLGLYLNYNPMILGFWYRGIPVDKNRRYDAVAILLGFRWENFSFGYSYDLTVSKLSTRTTAGSHEISLSYSYKSNKPKKKRRKDYVIPCPKF